MNKYNKVMENITVTDEMYDRIMKNVSTNIEKQNRRRHMISYRKLVPILAACLLLVTVFMFPWNNKDLGGDVMVVPDIVEYTTLNELSEDVGFDIEMLNGLSDVDYTVTYLSFWGELAEIRYGTLEDELTYRISKGIEDNSGDYNVFQVVRQINIGSYDVTVKGDDNLYYLAIWNDGSLSYSISSVKGFNKADLERLIN